VSTIVHLLLALALSLFLVCQGRALVAVVRLRRRHATGRRPRRTELLWTVIPVLVVLVLAARSWLVVFDIDRPAIASAVAPRATAEVRPSSLR
jgi:heme/copper-type cytochrome/quinol oxidase subunit 2